MILYFSATGNSRYLAQGLAERIGDRTLDIAEAMKEDCSFSLGECESVWIVSPVYFYGPPSIITDFIARMDFGREAEFNLILNFGTFPGTARDRFGKEMASRGLSFDRVFEIRMPENYIVMFDTPDREETESILDDADRTLDSVADIVRVGERRSIVTDNSLCRRMVSAFARPFYIHGRGTRKFHVNTKCMRCGRCVDLCPIGVIRMDGRIPVWTESKCIRCCACINGCPHDAIEFGLSTSKRRRYTNPRVRE